MRARATRPANLKPILISPVPSSAAVSPSARPISVKRLARLRINWFVVGSVFGVGLSFFMNFIISTLVMPGYQQLVVSRESLVVSEGSHSDASAAVEVENAANATPPLTTHDSRLTTPVYPVTLALKVNKGDTLLDMLIANHVQNSEAHQVITALKAKFNPQKISVGQRISVTLERHEKIGDAAAVKELAIKLPDLSTVALQRMQDGAFTVSSTMDESVAAQAKQKTFRGFGKVRTSLSQAGASAGIPAAIMSEVTKAFSYDIDFQREIHPGDTIEVLVDRKEQGPNVYSTSGGSLRYAALTLKGKKHEIFRFRNQYGEYAWFDGKGNSIKKSLLRTPVDAVHITSSFGMRTHPLLGYTKFHKGVDFGAPSGTPIMAAGDGIVTFKGWMNGYGNFVTIKHNGTYTTAYGHCSRFGDISVGSRVKQGQVIAYVGMTGMATGPHLHYEVRQNDIQVNPVAKQFNMASGLTGKQLASFMASKKAALGELASLAKPNAKLASR